MVRLLLVASLLTVAASTTPLLQNDQLQVLEKTYGIYARVGDSLDHVESTTEIPCGLGVVFGSRVALRYTAPEEVTLPIRGRWTTPAGPDRPPKVETFLPDPFSVRPGKIELGLDVIRTLKTPEQLLDGDYVLDFFDPATDFQYYERSFRVAGCP